MWKYLVAGQDIYMELFSLTNINKKDSQAEISLIRLPPCVLYLNRFMIMLHYNFFLFFIKGYFIYMSYLLDQLTCSCRVFPCNL